jgi:hypothetical protein
MLNSLNINKSKFCQSIGISVFAALLLSQNAMAADNDGHFFGKKATGKWIVGVKVGKIDNNEEDIKDADAVGILLGYEFGTPIGGSGSSTFELEYVSVDATNLQGIGEYNADVINAF